MFLKGVHIYDSYLADLETLMQPYRLGGLGEKMLNDLSFAENIFTKHETILEAMLHLSDNDRETLFQWYGTN